MLRNTYVILAALLFAQSTFAIERDTDAVQTIRMKPGVKRRSGFSLRKVTVLTGATISEAQGQAVDAESNTIGVSYATGYQAGVFADIGGQSWLLETGASYRRMGFVAEGFTSYMGQPGVPTRMQLSMDYLSVHLGGKYLIQASRAFKPYVRLGLVGAFLTRQELKSKVADNPEFTVNDSNIKKNEVGAIGGIGGSFNLGAGISLAPDVSYYRGITKLSDAEVYNAGWLLGILMGFEI